MGRNVDLHQGNGTARIFQGDRSVFTFSMHEQDLYPVKQQGSWDIGLAAFTSDSEYLPQLRDALPQILDTFEPDLVVYQAGADPFAGDKLGSLQLSKEGLAERDRIVIRESRSRGLPIVATLGGGYAEQTQDVVDIHTMTLQLIRESA